MLLSDKYPFITNYFTQALTTKNRALPQSILFYGNDIEAQYTLSKEIARLLNCKKDKSDHCDCLNCKWIRENTHPEIYTISRFDNKPEDDDAKTVISIKQSQMIKEILISSSDFHRVFIFCDKDENNNLAGLNHFNFQEETANSLLKIIEEPQPGVTFIFLTRYKDDVLSTIISRSQTFFIPSLKKNEYKYADINSIFANYYNIERKNVFKLSENLNNLTKTIPIQEILNQMQNYILNVLKTNSKQTFFINHIKLIEEAKVQANIGMKSNNIFDDLCLKLIN